VRGPKPAQGRAPQASESLIRQLLLTGDSRVGGERWFCCDLSFGERAEPYMDEREHGVPQRQGMSVAGMAAELRAQGLAADRVTGTTAQTGRGHGAGADGMTVAGLAEQRANGGAGVPGAGMSPVPGRSAGGRVKQMAVPRSAAGDFSCSTGMGPGTMVAAKKYAAVAGGLGSAAVSEAEVLFLVAKALHDRCPRAAQVLVEEAECGGMFGSTRDWMGARPRRGGHAAWVVLRALNARLESAQSQEGQGLMDHGNVGCCRERAIALLHGSLPTYTARRVPAPLSPPPTCYAPSAAAAHYFWRWGGGATARLAVAASAPSAYWGITALC
jgi:hypothetical protein